MRKIKTHWIVLYLFSTTAAGKLKIYRKYRERACKNEFKLPLTE